MSAAADAAAQVQNRSKSEVDSLNDAARGKKKDADANRGLRLVYAIIILVIMGGQIAIADRVFYLYGEANHWVIPGGVISAWLGATVIEVIGVVVVIARFLFSEQSSA